jgi:hypothetical protein
MSGLCPGWPRAKKPPGISLLKYWRDTSSHGALNSLNENEAFISIALLLRFCIFVNKNFPAP